MRSRVTAGLAFAKAALLVVLGFQFFPLMWVQWIPLFSDVELGPFWLPYLIVIEYTIAPVALAFFFGALLGHSIVDGSISDVKGAYRLGSIVAALAWLIHSVVLSVPICWLENGCGESSFIRGLSLMVPMFLALLIPLCIIGRYVGGRLYIKIQRL